MTTQHAPLSVDELPGPRGLPVLGNVLDIDAAGPMAGFVRMAGEYGPIFKLDVPGGVRVFVSGPDLVDEVCDDARFDKLVGGGLASLRAAGAGPGLFAADTDDPLWHRAHSILLAPFGLQAMRDYIPAMLDVAEQLMDKWARLNPGDDVDVPDDMTRLTLDTIALCGFGYRFNSFYRDTPHPFVEAMVRTLAESQARTRQLPIQTRLKVRAQRQVEEDQAFMNTLVDRLVAERRAQGTDGVTTDLLGRMLTGVDRRTGERLPDDNIRDQCITFLVAGHETTSGLLSFATYFLIKNPDVMGRARAEVDAVLGTTAAPTFEQVQRLTYVRQVLDEALRLWPTAPGFMRQPREDTVIGGRYALPAGTPVNVLSQALHQDRTIWGADAAEFDPDHTAPDRMAALPPHAYKPFGTGQRACIGRQFALQEATLVLGDAAAALRARRPPRLPAHHQGDPDDQARRVPHPGAAPPRRAPRPRPRRPGAAPVRGRGPGGRPGAAGRPARHAAVGAVRIQHGHRRVAGHPAGPGGHRARLRRHPRRARRPRRRPSARRRGDHRVCLVQRHSAGQRRCVLPVARRGAGGCGQGCGVHGLRLRQHRVGRHLPVRPDPARRAARGVWRAARARPRCGQRGRRLRRCVPRLAERAVGGPGRRARAAGRGGRRRADRPAVVDRAHPPADHQPGDRLLRCAAHADQGEPRTASRRGAAGPPGTWRSHCRPGCPTRRATISACSHATTWRSSAGS